MESAPESLGWSTQLVRQGYTDPSFNHRTDLHSEHKILLWPLGAMPSMLAKTQEFIQAHPKHAHLLGTMNQIIESSKNISFQDPDRYELDAFCLSLNKLRLEPGIARIRQENGTILVGNPSEPLKPLASAAEIVAPHPAAGQGRAM